MAINLKVYLFINTFGIHKYSRYSEANTSEYLKISKKNGFIGSI